MTDDLRKLDLASTRMSISAPTGPGRVTGSVNFDKSFSHLDNSMHHSYSTDNPQVWPDTA
jgi:hypothetical protein